MKRFHVNLAVSDLDRSRQFYSRLFDQEPSVLKDDYAKWMLEDPRLNFSITRSAGKRGVQHLGFQFDTGDELTAIADRLQQSGESTVDQPQTECCYARSSKTWTRDPDDVAWETFVTHEQIAQFGSAVPSVGGEQPGARRCCA
ncbi:MAG: ArsI/CadI family heavy metal resistance metalloenzyme [Woeseiaceae bacterium]